MSSASGSDGAPAPRRTFAIISHPDAGKTTLTEKLLLFGGAIQLAGTVKGRKAARHATSDWMRLEQQRGISVTSSVMQFPFNGCIVNLLDTPGHEDFSEDTYRTLTAADSAVMVLDAAKGIEPQTLKLFEVCRLRDIPIITFINKMDREAQDPFALLDEIHERLALDVSPVQWPAGSGNRFRGVVDLQRDEFIVFHRPEAGEVGPAQAERIPMSSNSIVSAMSAELLEETRETAGLAKEALPKFDIQAYREGQFQGEQQHRPILLDRLGVVGEREVRPHPVELHAPEADDEEIDEGRHEQRREDRRRRRDQPIGGATILHPLTPRSQSPPV